MEFSLLKSFQLISFSGISQALTCQLALGKDFDNGLRCVKRPSISILLFATNVASGLEMDPI